MSGMECLPDPGKNGPNGAWLRLFILKMDKQLMDIGRRLTALESREAERRGGWQVWTGITTGVMALIGVIYMYFRATGG